MQSNRKKILAEQLDKLEELNTQDLKELWVRYFPQSNHSGLRKSYMQDELAHAIQSKLYGGLSKPVKRQIQRLALEKTKSTRSKTSIAEGVELVREWNGIKHKVTSVSNGFEYQGKTYKSLSKVAMEITGTRWSGPVFFGFKQGRKANG